MKISDGENITTLSSFRKQQLMRVKEERNKCRVLKISLCLHFSPWLSLFLSVNVPLVIDWARNMISTGSTAFEDVVKDFCS